MSREARDGGGYLIESDFDFRSPPSTRDNSRDRKPRLDLEESIRRPNRRPQDHNHVTRRTEEVYAYPRRGQEDVYASPRRKELRIAVGETSKRPSSDLRGYARWKWGGGLGMNGARSDIQCYLENCGLIVVFFHENVANNFVNCN